MGNILVAGGAGFIGSNFVYDWLENERSSIVNFDKLTYAGNLKNLIGIKQSNRHIFVKGEIQDREAVRELLNTYSPEGIVNFAAETHVDRSIVDPEAFIQTNIVGTYHLVDEALAYWKTLKGEKKDNFRFLQISTDEVYGSLLPTDPSSTESSPYEPNSPYSASKAASDHLVRSYFQTYGLPTMTSHSSNNFGPYQFPEKLIPLMIANAMQGKPLPIYGDGLNIRDWLYVADHCSALRLILKKGIPGQTYNIGSDAECTNKELVHHLCDVLDELLPQSPNNPHRALIQYVKDRPGHDRRYSLDSTKLRNELGWKPQDGLDTNLRKTVKWYLENSQWIADVQSGEYREWIKLNYLERERV